MSYDSKQDTLEHIVKVQHRMNEVTDRLQQQLLVHDQSKLESPEKELFDAVTPKLKTLTYGSDEYKATLKEMGPALQHHYEWNSHHPEHYTNGIDGMDLLDLVEMFCDWKAASERHANGDFSKSLDINRARFNVSEQLAHIFENTRNSLDW